MDPLLILSFTILAVIIIIVPGPNVLVIISTSLAHGIHSGLLTVAGTTTALAIQLVIAALSTAWFIEGLTEGFTWLHWFGVAYLVYLGLMHLLQVRHDPVLEPLTPSSSSIYLRGFVVSLTNPKTIVFFCAFLPQFVSVESPYLLQISVLSVIFLSLAVLLDSLYAVFASRMRNYLKQRRVDSFSHILSGVIFLIVGIWLAVSRPI